MKTAFNEEGGKPPDEVKSPINVGQILSISSLANRLHSFISPARGDFIEKT